LKYLILGEDYLLKKICRKNKYCKISDLYNESDVEQKFIIRLLKDLNFKDSQIKTKKDIKDLIIGKGRKKEKFRPDYLIFLKNKPKLIIDAKNPITDKDITKFEYQLSSYAIQTNQEFKGNNPLNYFIISNAYTTSLYKWDESEPIIILEFEDFVDNNKKFNRFKEIIEEIKKFKTIKPPLKLIKLPVKDLKDLFNKCHNKIWKKEKIGPTKAFYEFSKIIFIKMKEDRKVIDIIKKEGKITEDELVFSVHWIEKNEKTEANPFNKILFRNIRDELEEEIIKRKKKRIFITGDELNLKPNTIKETVRMLEKYDLHSIDEDLNGRMFETFLNATIRGKELGQFFTPRRVVKYMVNTADIKIDKQKISDIIDGCCGSGGFLIEAMAVMINKIKNRTHLTDIEKAEFEEDIKNNHLFGIDANLEIASIARMNMYLHGDGGSNIFSTDSLDKEIMIEEGENIENKRDTKQLKNLLLGENKKFDIVLTNPPFSMKYNKKDENEKRILNAYEIGSLGQSIKSNILFIERYNDLLVGSGQLITIIDDSILNAPSGKKYLDYIKKKFIIKQVISLPFNAFKNAGTSTKTSILYLRKKKTPEEQQPDIFMAICNNIGHDDFGRETLSRNNLIQILKEYQEYKKLGKPINIIINNQLANETLTCPLQIFTSKFNKTKDRLDAFYYSPELEVLENKMDRLIKSKERELFDKSKFSIIPNMNLEDYKKIKENKYKYVEVGNITAKGTIENMQEDKLKNLPTRARKQVKKGDVIIAKSISCIGQNTIIPELLDGHFVSTGFIVLRPKKLDKEYKDSYILWSYLRQEYVKKQFYYKAATAVQPEINEIIFKNEIKIPVHTNQLTVSNIINGAMKIVEIKGESLLSKIDQLIEL
jgi:type I restriction enzyme M protein